MTKNPGASLNDQLFAQLERLGDVNLSDEALQEEVSRSKAICLKTQIQLQIGENMMLLQQIRDEAPRLLSFHPEAEECFKAQCRCLEALSRALEDSGTLPAA